MDKSNEGSQTAGSCDSVLHAELGLIMGSVESVNRKLSEILAVLEEIRDASKKDKA